MRGKRRFFAMLLSAAMVMSTFSATAFGGIVDDLQTAGNVMVMVSVDNEDCEMLEKVEKDLEVHITAKDSDVDVKVPVEKVEEADGMYSLWINADETRIKDEVMRQLAEIQGEVDLGEFEANPIEIVPEVDEALNAFQVEVLGLPEGHYTIEEYNAPVMIITNEIVQQAVDTIKDALKEEDIEFTSFKDLIDRMLKEMDTSVDELLDTSDWTDEDWAAMEEMGLTQEVIDGIKDLVEHIDEVVDYLCSEDFSGMLIANVILSCDCDKYCSYQIQHIYYERVDGELKWVGTTYSGEYDEERDGYFLRDKVGTEIDFAEVEKPEYDGREYEYIGAYDGYMALSHDEFPFGEVNENWDLVDEDNDGDTYDDIDWDEDQQVDADDIDADDDEETVDADDEDMDGEDADADDEDMDDEDADTDVEDMDDKDADTDVEDADMDDESGDLDDMDLIPGDDIDWDDEDDEEGDFQWENYEIDKFVLDEESLSDWLVLRYVYEDDVNLPFDGDDEKDESTTTTGKVEPLEDEPAGSGEPADEPVKTTKPEPPAVPAAGQTPETGDDSPLAAYVLLLLAALCAEGMLAAYQRRRVGDK